jgi:hypothetical protein
MTRPVFAVFRLARAKKEPDRFGQVQKTGFGYQEWSNDKKAASAPGPN